MRCDRVGCPVPAVCSLGIEIYPPHHVMAHFNRTSPLSRMIVGIVVCNLHAEQAIDEGAFALIGEDQTKSFGGLISRSTNVEVDHAGYKVVRIAFDDEDYLMLQRQRSASNN